MDIIKLPIQTEDKVVDSRFRLVIMAAQRARQITEGSEVRVDSKYVKNTTLALEEAIEGKLKFLTGDDAISAREYEYKRRREQMARESMEQEAQAASDKFDSIRASYMAETAATAAPGEDDEMDDVVDEVMDDDELADDMSGAGPEGTDDDDF
jgi:DNA-directed RNA polymerase subunit omega